MHPPSPAPITDSLWPFPYACYPWGSLLIVWSANCELNDPTKCMAAQDCTLAVRIMRHLRVLIEGAIKGQSRCHGGYARRSRKQIVQFPVGTCSVAQLRFPDFSSFCFRAHCHIFSASASLLGFPCLTQNTSRKKSFAVCHPLLVNIVNSPGCPVPLFLR